MKMSLRKLSGLLSFVALLSGSVGAAQYYQQYYQQQPQRQQYYQYQVPQQQQYYQQYYQQQPQQQHYYQYQAPQEQQYYQQYQQQPQQYPVSQDDAKMALVKALNNVFSLKIENALKAKFEKWVEVANIDINGQIVDELTKIGKASFYDLVKDILALRLNYLITNYVELFYREGGNTSNEFAVATIDRFVMQFFSQELAPIINLVLTDAQDELKKFASVLANAGIKEEEIAFFTRVVLAFVTLVLTVSEDELYHNKTIQNDLKNLLTPIVQEYVFGRKRATVPLLPVQEAVFEQAPSGPVIERPATSLEAPQREEVAGKPSMANILQGLAAQKERLRKVAPATEKVEKKEGAFGALEQKMIEKRQEIQQKESQEVEEGQGEFADPEPVIGVKAPELPSRLQGSKLPPRVKRPGPQIAAPKVRSLPIRPQKALSTLEAEALKPASVGVEGVEQPSLEEQAKKAVLLRKALEEGVRRRRPAIKEDEPEEEWPTE